MGLTRKGAHRFPLPVTAIFFELLEPLPDNWFQVPDTTSDALRHVGEEISSKATTIRRTK